MKFLITAILFSFALSLNAQVISNNDIVTQQTTNTTVTFSNFQTAAGTNRLIVAILPFTGPGVSVSSITYNGQNFTFGVKANQGAINCELWYLALGTGGSITSDVVINFDNTPALFEGGVVTFQNVNQTTPFGNTDTNAGNAGSSTLTINANTSDLIIDGIGAVSPNTSQTSLFKLNLGGGSYLAAASGNNNMTWSFSGSDFAHVGAAINHDGVTFLPIELTYFKGENIDNQNKLTWQTASEKNNHGFHIEKSTNGTDWEEIGFVQGNGTTTEVSNYEFVDNLDFPSLEDLESLNYYRLKQTDFDGKLRIFKYHSTGNSQPATGNESLSKSNKRLFNN